MNNYNFAWIVNRRHVIIQEFVTTYLLSKNLSLSFGYCTFFAYQHVFNLLWRSENISPLKNNIATCCYMGARNPTKNLA